jgi:hypothetical protein
LVKVRIVANPANDQRFVRRVQDLAEDVDSPEQLEQLLRREYSRARVVRGVTDVVERWYAYRDGRWTNSNDLT